MTWTDYVLTILEYLGHQGPLCSGKPEVKNISALKLVHLRGKYKYMYTDTGVIKGLWKLLMKLKKD